MPHVFHVDSEPGIDGHGVLAMEFCQGRHLDFPAPGDVACAARMLADIHAVDPVRRQVLARPEDPLRAQLEECRRLFAGYRNTPFESVQVASFVERFFERAEHVAIAAGSPAGSGHVLNTEAVSDHFLIPEDAPDDGHMVDWEKPVVGEVAQDVAYFLAPTTTIWSTDFVFTAEERDAFVHTYWQAVGGRFARGDFEARYAAYLMSNCLRGVTWSCNAWVEYHDPRAPGQKPQDLREAEGIPLRNLPRLPGARDLPGGRPPTGVASQRGTPLAPRIGAKGPESALCAYRGPRAPRQRAVAPRSVSPFPASAGSGGRQAGGT